MPQEPPHKVPQEPPHKVLQVHHNQGAPGTTTQGAPGTTTQGAPGTTTKGAPGTTTQGAPGTTTKGVPGTTPGSNGTVGTTTKGAPGTTTQGAPGTTTTGKVCSEMEYINTLVATNAVRTSPKDIPDKDDLISKGVDFTDKKPTIVIDVPEGGAIVRDIKVPSSNILEIEVVFKTESGRVTAPIRGSPTSLPKDKFPQEKVSEIVVKVIKTLGDKAPEDVTLSVIACAEGPAGTTTKGAPATTTKGAPGTTTQGAPGTTTQGAPGTTTQGAPGTTTKGAPGTTTQGAPGTTTKGAPGTTTQGAPGTTTKGVPGTTPGSNGTVGTTTKGAPGTTTQGAPGTTTTGKVCSEMEYINTLVATNAVRTSPKDIPDKDDLISKGVDFTDKKPTIVIDVPEGGAIVRDIKVPSSNILEIEVVFKTESGRVTAPIRGSPTSLPKDKFPQEKVSEIVVKVIKTLGDKAPEDVTLSVIACAEGPAGTTTKGAPATTTKGAPGTTTQGAPGTTTQGAPGTTTQGAPGTTTQGAAQVQQPRELQELPHKVLRVQQRREFQARRQDRMVPLELPPRVPQERLPRVLQAQRPLARFAAKWNTSTHLSPQTPFEHHPRIFQTRMI